MKHLIVVDMQNDFISGSLPATITKSAILNMQVYIKNFPGVVIFTKDTHDINYHNTLEGKMLPTEHCIKNTKGWEIIDELRDLAAAARIIEKNTFASIKLARIMQAVNSEEIYICGVCTDICVISNALMIRGYCPNTPITCLYDLCGGTTIQNHLNALNVMESCQIKCKSFLEG